MIELKKQKTDEGRRRELSFLVLHGGWRLWADITGEMKL
jgi:hypothetical protein